RLLWRRHQIDNRVIGRQRLWSGLLFWNWDGIVDLAGCAPYNCSAWLSEPVFKDIPSQSRGHADLHVPGSRVITSPAFTHPYSSLQLGFLSPARGGVVCILIIRSSYQYVVARIPRIVFHCPIYS